MEDKEIEGYIMRMMATDPEAKRKILELTTEGVNAIFSGDKETQERTVAEKTKLLKDFIENCDEADSFHKKDVQERTQAMSD